MLAEALQLCRAIIVLGRHENQGVEVLGHYAASGRLAVVGRSFEERTFGDAVAREPTATCCREPSRALSESTKGCAFCRVQQLIMASYMTDKEMRGAGAHTHTHTHECECFRALAHAQVFAFLCLLLVWLQVE